MKERVGDGRGNIFLRLGNAIAVRSLMVVLAAFLSCLAMKGEIIGDTVVVIRNNFTKGETVNYDCGIAQLRIEGNDSILESLSISKAKFTLKDILEDGNKLFEMQMRFKLPEKIAPDEEKLDEMFKKMLRILEEKPQSFLTDSNGAIKEMCNYNEVSMELDSCLNMLNDWIATVDVTEEEADIMRKIFADMADKMLSEEAIMQKMNLFQYYGDEFYLGTIIYKMRVKCPLFDSVEVDATIDTTCYLTESSTGGKIVTINNEVIYDGDQIIERMKSGLFTEEQIRATGLDNPETAYMLITDTVTCTIELESGKILKYETTRRVNEPHANNMICTIMRLSE